jgi:methylated-DNA-[protein]-cysteine S-methyltransferase
MDIELFGYRTAVDETRIDESREEIKRQLGEYTAGDRREFDLTVAYPEDFLGEVMNAMEKIPYGDVCTYGELADRIDTAAVAVGQACGRNPVGPIVPCHRVVGHDSLGGFSSEGGVALKRCLLDHEGAF